MIATLGLTYAGGRESGNPLQGDLMNPYCQNRRCKDPLAPMSRDWLCPSCKFIGRAGMMIGGLVVGIVGALLKWWKVI